MELKSGSVREGAAWYVCADIVIWMHAVNNLFWIEFFLRKEPLLGAIHRGVYWDVLCIMPDRFDTLMYLDTEADALFAHCAGIVCASSSIHWIMLKVMIVDVL